MEKSKAYERLTPQRKALIDEVLKNLESGVGLWAKGWANSGVPESAITGKKYRGLNNFHLFVIAMKRGYKDNRWLTYKQMEDRGWHFKTNEEEQSLGKNAGVSIEFFELIDRKTKKPFTRLTVMDLDEAERQEYIEKNVYPLRKYYRVFNGDIIDGLPEKEAKLVDENAKSERTEKFINHWSNTQSEIIYGGNDAYYNVKQDKIMLPKREDFFTLQDYYATALHEIGHSTGHESRLNRHIENKFGTAEYAVEELRAEIASMFLEQEFGVELDEQSIRNNSAYIDSWRQEITENPNVLFEAIADADKIAKYVVSKEEAKKDIELYSIVEKQNEFGETKFSVVMLSNDGQIVPAVGEYDDSETMLKDFEKMQKMSYWANKEFSEIPYEMLTMIAMQKTEQQVVEEQSAVYRKPSEFVAMSALPIKQVDMSNRGKESLAKMSDREVVERAESSKSGEKFSQLYNGKSLFNDEEKDERSLMTRLAVYVNGDKEQLIRIFRSSGQYREQKPNGLYDSMAEDSIKFVSQTKQNLMATKAKIQPTQNRHYGINAKT